MLLPVIICTVRSRQPPSSCSLIDNPDAAVVSVNDVLSRWSERWLLVFDNLDNPEDLPGIVGFFPSSQYGSILVTSRHARCKDLGQSIELDCMEKEEGLQLLLRSSTVDSDELDAAEEILSLLGNLPLGIDQARAYISKRRLGLRAFVTEYERRKQSVMEETPHIWQYRKEETPQSVDYVGNVFTAAWGCWRAIGRVREGHNAFCVLQSCEHQRTTLQ